MAEPRDQTPAASIQVLDLHLDYLRKDVARLVDAVGNMATKDDIKALQQQMGSYATRDELRALEARLESASIPSTLDRWAGRVQKIGAAAAILGGGAVLLANLLEKLK